MNSQSRRQRTSRPFAAAALLATTALLLSALASPASSLESWEMHGIHHHKAPNHRTPADTLEQWRAEDRVLHKRIADLVPEALDHTGSETFDEHLKGVQSILRHWDAPKHLYEAGLFHSIYGSEGFQGYSLPLSERGTIEKLIGAKGERLVWIFCMVDRSTVDQTVFSWTEGEDDHEYTFLARPELGRFPIVLNKHEWVDFLELSLADWLQQVQGASESASEIFHWEKGQAFTYRRQAYARMVEILSHEIPVRQEHAVWETYSAVYEKEDSQFWNLEQKRTPPMSEAAKRANEALRSAGEDIPEIFAPQPMEVASDEL